LSRFADESLVQDTFFRLDPNHPHSGSLEVLVRNGAAPKQSDGFACVYGKLCTALLRWVFFSWRRVDILWEFGPKIAFGVEKVFHLVKVFHVFRNSAIEHFVKLPLLCLFGNRYMSPFFDRFMDNVLIAECHI
jgi:hypothetical protein